MQPSGPNPPFANVVALFGFEGANGSTAIVDESSYARPVTVVGGAQISTAKTFVTDGASSLFLPTAGSSYITMPFPAFAAGPFTIEGRFRWLTGSGPSLFEIYEGATLVMRLMRSASDGRVFLTFSTNGTTVAHTLAPVGSPTYGPNTDYHICLERDASDIVRLYQNGVYNPNTKATISGTLVRNASTVPRLGANINGYMDEWRFTDGVARNGVDASFDPGTTAYPRS
ncbi:hypothetical protein KEU06_13715 [Pseudaminobacter sp. 19-2017]|uniref:LamG domain-containing protein n=1 Tax=Pseudaminobacter soli (ex Zhang et al. 2022) TaxID=2831468 RepID=A0A942E306_9HYPH|nr:LamG-like jellyroll fold domain-containing protein [Pseudaminobacter soli]MBS3649665.1 hypothetical protein [Pseudaminobacter soli]